MKIRHGIIIFLCCCMTQVRGIFEYDRAVHAGQQGDWNIASSFFADLIRDNPDKPDLLYDAGVASFKQKKFKCAEACFSHSCSSEVITDELKELAHFNWGNTCVELRKLQEAIEQYESVLALNPDNEKAKHNLDVIKKMLEQQQQQDQNDQQNKDDSKNQQNQNKDQQKNQNDKNQNQDDQNQQDQKQNKNKNDKQKQEQNQQNRQDKQKNQDSSEREQKDKSKSEQEKTNQQQNDKKQSNGSSDHDKQEEERQDGRSQDSGKQSDTDDNRQQEHRVSDESERKQNKQEQDDKTGHENSPEQQGKEEPRSEDQDKAYNAKEQEKGGGKSGGQKQAYYDGQVTRILQAAEDKDAQANKKMMAAQVKQATGCYDKNQNNY